MTIIKKKGRNSAGYMVYKTPRIIKLKKTNREIKMNKYEQYHWWKKRKQHRRKEKSGRRVHRIKVTEIGTRKAEQRAENWETGRDWNMVGEKKRQSKHLLDVRCSHWRCVFFSACLSCERDWAWPRRSTFLGHHLLSVISLLPFRVLWIHISSHE